MLGHSNCSKRTQDLARWEMWHASATFQHAPCWAPCEHSQQVWHWGQPGTRHTNNALWHNTLGKLGEHA
eukprot:6237908-Lingulodinium_polyedra.AAC.1